MQNHTLLTIGVMTGNSVDGVDTVLTAFHPDGTITDLESHFEPFSDQLYHPIRALQAYVAATKGNMQQVSSTFYWEIPGDALNFDELNQRFIQTVADAVKALILKAKSNSNLQDYNLDAIDAVGFHGQTCDHCPPSRIGGFDKDRVYTVQIGDGQALADQLGITVIHDFRSDDIMHGGEGAPFAPMHNQHIALSMREKGFFPLTFCNGGNTGNLSHITQSEHNEMKTLGWDTGPFNHYPDLISRNEFGLPYDKDGTLGAQGQIQLPLLQALFDTAVPLSNGVNYLTLTPPKSGDPNYYLNIKELQVSSMSTYDRLRTAEYAAAYMFFHSLGFTPQTITLPCNFALYGGGWQNPIILEHFRGLLAGNWVDNPVLAQHQKWFNGIHKRLARTGTPYADQAIAFGFDGQVMEARIIADMARCKLLGIPFSTPDTTGVTKPVIGGIVRYPNQLAAKATAQAQKLLSNQPVQTTVESRWSRAAGGWAS